MSSRRLVVSIPFDEYTWSFKPDYPSDLRPVLPVDQWGAIVQRLNTDLNLEMRRKWDAIDRWIKYSAVGSLVVVGIPLWVVVAYKMEQHKRVVRDYWRHVRKYLAHLNREDARRHRSLQWRLVLNEERMAEESETMVPTFYRCITIEWSR